MPDYNEYRRKAEYAQQQANRAKTPLERESWLRLVEGWLSLLPKRARNPAEQFEEQVRAEGTHQNVTERQQ